MAHLKNPVQAGLKEEQVRVAIRVFSSSSYIFEKTLKNVFVLKLALINLRIFNVFLRCLHKKHGFSVIINGDAPL